MKLEIKSKPQQTEFSAFTKLIDPHTEIVVVVPWNGKPVPVTIRMLDSVTLNACGDFNTLNAVIEDSKNNKVDNELIIKTKNIHENILRHCLVKPTFTELEEYLKQKDFYLNIKAEIKRVEQLIEQIPSMEQREAFAKELEILELSAAFLLPEDFTGSIVAIIMQKEATDIHKLTKEALLRVGLLAERYNVRPSSYLEGTFTQKQNEDIDMAAVSIVHEYREMQKVEKGKTRWIRGKK